MDNKRVTNAIQKFQTGSSCAQSVLATYLPLLGISEPLAHKMGAGLGGGIGRKQYVCGAVNAGAIVLSTYFGNETSADPEQKEYAAERVRQLMDNFERQFGSAQCRDLLGVDTNTEEGKKSAEDNNVYRNVCDACVEHVCQQLEKVIAFDKA